jgi:hypothetical protein
MIETRTTDEDTTAAGAVGALVARIRFICGRGKLRGESR